MISDERSAVEQLRFDEFAPPTYDEWREAALASLDGKPFDKLITQTYEGISLQPLYRQEDVVAAGFLDTLPGQAPFLRGTEPAGYLARPWSIAQALTGVTPAALNRSLHEALAGGQDVALLKPDRLSRRGADPDPAGPVGRDGVSLATAADIAEALRGVDLASVSLRLQPGAAALPLAALVVAAAGQGGYAPGDLRGWIAFDPVGTLAEAGALPTSLEGAWDDAAALTRWAAGNGLALGTLAVHTVAYHDAGASAVQELAIGMATGAVVLRALAERGLDVDTVAPRLGFEFAVGGQFFMEIAKLRAARLLWSQVVAAFGGGEAAQGMRLHGRSAYFNKTTLDPHVNMLRVTTEGLAAAVAGVDSLGLTPFDEPARPADSFSTRIARNVQVILQEEAGLTRLIDPAGGSWAVEALTDRLARDAWALFQEIERRGGMAAVLASGWIQAEIGAVAARRAAALAKRRDVLVGTNQYANPAEQPLPVDRTDHAAVARDRAAAVAAAREQQGDAVAAALEAAASGADRVQSAIAAARAGATLGQISAALWAGQAPASVTPLEIHRAAEPFEALRAAADAYAGEHGMRPRLFLANLGPPRQHKARADFTQGFFETGGFEVLTNTGFKTPQDAAAAALASGAPAVAICSTDETYPELVPPLVAAIKAAAPETVIILAGRPADQVEALTAAGVDEFIAFGMDALAINQRLLQRIGTRSTQRQDTEPQGSAGNTPALKGRADA
jgi:methylmalonyl-CoA mutase